MLDKPFAKWCDEAGLPERCAPHGLRHARGRPLAEGGENTGIPADLGLLN